MKDKYIVRVNISAIFLVLTFAIKSITDAVYVAHGISSIFTAMKYVTMLCGIAYALIMINGRKKRDLIWKKEFISLLSVVVVFGFISLVALLFTPKDNSALLSELFKLAIGPVYAFLIINTCDEEHIYRSMKLILLLGMLGYILEIGTGAFSIANFRSISFWDSYSPFESSYAAGTAVTVATYFIYFNKEKRYTILSMLFVFLTFKRASVLFIAILFIVRKFKKKWDKPLNRRWSVILVILFTISTYVYMYLLDPSNSSAFSKLFSTSTNQFTMGRSLRYQYLISYGFKSFGFGSSTVALGTNMEMDLVKIALELSFVGLVFFLCMYTFIIRNNLYCYLLMFFNFFNMLTSHSLSGNFSWTLKFIVIACIVFSSKEETRLNDSKEGKESYSANSDAGNSQYISRN